MNTDLTDPSNATWTPIIAPSSFLSDSAWTIINCVVEKSFQSAFLESTIPERRSDSEAALLFLFWALGRDEPIWIERMVDTLNSVISEVDCRIKFPGLHGGMCGLGWTTQYVYRFLKNKKRGACFASYTTCTEDPLEEIDSYLFGILSSWGARKSHDAIGSLVGCGVYFLERMPRRSAAESLSVIVKLLALRCERSREGVAWRTTSQFLSPSVQKRCPDGFFDLGVAHGIAGVIYLLGELVHAQIGQNSSRVLLEEAVAWLLTHQRPPGSQSVFSSWIAPGYSFDTPPAWCYGDVGIMAVLFQVARRTGRSELRHFALDLLDRCLLLTVDTCDVRNAGLCHGACGIAHILNRIYQVEGDPRCKAACSKWFELGINIWLKKTNHRSISPSARGNSAKPFKEFSPEFLDGSIGVALALLAAVTPVEPQWDRLLLLSGRGHDGDTLR